MVPDRDLMCPEKGLLLCRRRAESQPLADGPPPRERPSEFRITPAWRCCFWPENQFWLTVGAASSQREGIWPLGLARFWHQFGTSGCTGNGVGR